MFRFAFPLVVSAVTASAITFQVTPNGPTLIEARDAIRKLKDAGPLKEAVRVEIADGTYLLAEPFILEARDSGTKEFPITYTAAPGAKPLFSAGKKIAGLTVGADGVWTANVDPAWRFEVLWVNGQRAQRARTPNAGYLQATGAPTAPLPGIPLDSPLASTALKVSPTDAAPLAALSPEERREANVVVYHSWQTSRHRLAGVDGLAGTLQFTGPARWNFFQLEPYHRLHFENFRAALDAPGEWFLASDGTLSYFPRPGETPDKSEAVAAVGGQWLAIRGEAEKARVEHLRFEGLRFAHQAWALPEKGWSSAQADPELPGAIEVEGANDLLFLGCEFAHTQTHALKLKSGVRDVRLERCHFHDLGAGGVYIGEMAVPKNDAAATGRVTLENCLLRGGGRYFPGSIGVWIGQSGDNSIVHCDIGDFFYSAISIGWEWGFRPRPCMNNRVERCHLHHLGWGVLSDLAAVYTLGPQPGTIIKGCRVHDIACASYGGWGLYNDEGSTGIVWEDNLVYRTQSGGYHQHYGRENIVRNNIFAFASEMQLRHSRSEPHLAFTFEQNIVLFDEGQLLGHLDAGWQGAQVKLARNLYWRRDGQPFDFAGKDFAAWQATGQDAGSLIADPLFVDPDRKDFRLRDGSPASKIGFKPFDYSLAGLTGDPAWRALADAPLPDVTFPTKPEPVPLALEEGFDKIALGGKPPIAHLPEGERSGRIVVSDEAPATGARCLKITDGPEVEPPFNPHFYYQPHHRRGTTRVGFALKVEAGIHFIHEWRKTVGAKYRTGPMFTIEQGQLSVPGRVLRPMPEGAWVRFEIESCLGKDAPGIWTLVVTPANGPPERFEGLKWVHPDAGELDWLGFVSAGQAAASYWLDDLSLVNLP